MGCPSCRKHVIRPLLDVSTCMERWSWRGIWKALALRALSYWKAWVGCLTPGKHVIFFKSSLSDAIWYNTWSIEGWMKLIMSRKLWSCWTSVGVACHLCLEFQLDLVWYHLLWPYIHRKRFVAVECHTFFNWSQDPYFFQVQAIFFCSSSVFQCSTILSCMP